MPEAGWGIFALKPAVRLAEGQKCTSLPKACKLSLEEGYLVLKNCFEDLKGLFLPKQHYFSQFYPIQYFFTCKTNPFSLKKNFLGDKKKKYFFPCYLGKKETRVGNMETTEGG